MGTINKLVIRKKHYPLRFVVKNLPCFILSSMAFLIYIPVGTNTMIQGPPAAL